MRDVAVVGSLNVDVSVRAERLPRAGETVRAHDLEIGAGGKGLNQAIAAARMGARVHMVGRVGDDAFGQLALGALAGAGIDTSHVLSTPDEATGTALITVEEATGQNAIAVAGGANARVTPADVTAARDAIAASAVVLVQLELPDATVEAVLTLARACGAQSILDPAPARSLPAELLRRADVLTPNETEAELLAGQLLGDPDAERAAAELLHGRTGAELILTLGERGCLWAGSKGIQRFEAPRVRALDTTGAGDAFNGGLAAALAAGAGMQAAIRQAIRSGSAATLRRGAAAAMPTPEDLDRYIPEA
jgi:ribokinase